MRIVAAVSLFSPFGMMVRLLGEEGDAGHEAERRDKVLELELLGDGVPTASGELPTACVVRAEASCFLGK